MMDLHFPASRVLAGPAVVVLLAGCASVTTPPSAVPARTAVPSLAVATPTVAPTPSPTSAPTPAPTPAATPSGELRWDRIGSVPVAEAGDWGRFSVVGFDAGYVVVGGDDDAWFSADGAKWTRVRLAGASAAATDGRHVLVVGSSSPCGGRAYNRNRYGACRVRPAAWISTDGRTWKASRPWTGRVGPVGLAGSAFQAVWAVPTGGWDAAQVFSGSDPSDDFEPIGLALWHSDNGRSWSPLVKQFDALDQCYYEDSSTFGAVVGSGSLRVLFANGCYSDESDPRGPGLWSSADGRTWKAVTAWPESPSSWIGAAIPRLGGGPWLFVGEQVGGGGSGGDIEAVGWATPDLATWTSFRFPVPACTADPGTWAQAVTRAGSRYVAAGACAQSGLTWVSDDGFAWRLADAGTGVQQLAVGPVGLLGFGIVKVDEDTYRLDVWASQ